MPSQPYTRQMVFDGGIVNSIADELIPDNCLADARNIIPNPSGGGNLVKRYGYASSLAGVASKNVSAFHSGYLNRYYSCYDSGTAKDFIIYDLDDGTELYAETTPANEVYFASLNGVDYCNTGSHELKTTDGTTWAAWSGAFTDSVLSRPYIMSPYNNMLFGMARTGPPATVAWSAVGDADTWSATQAIELDSGGTNSNYNPASALIPFRSVLVVFTLECMFHLQGYGITDISVPFFRKDIGCIGPKAVVATPFGLVWWSATMGIVKSADGYNVETPMQAKLKSTLNTIQTYQGTGIHCIYRPDLRCVRFFVPTAAASKYVTRIDYYPETDTFWIQSLSTLNANGVSASCVTVDNTYATAGVNEFVSAGIAVYKESSSAVRDGTTDTVSYVQTKRYSEQTVMATKTALSLRPVTKLVSSEALSLEVFADNATSAGQTISFSPAAGVVDTKVGVNQTSRKIQYKLSDGTGLNQRWELYSLNEYGNVEMID